ncbi:hypothetical protein [Streptomyces sp. H27-C3]|uniref:hypothetical protein n=1 Tax=Streptomyces sp. H27-C3 TaxID=3046305 RepID=UPI0024BA6679|nr:hypothetical protein [Streptomyces sp. H27-C3]MDJ0460575.1 hypothetical protein [Streptomyces sp. H27-C3]
MVEYYPNLLAGQRLRASTLRDMLPMTARKTSDTSRTATTTAVADPHLTFDLVANAVYIMDGWIKFDGPAAADLNIDWTAPSGTLGEWAAMGAGNGQVVSANTTPALIADTQSSRGYLVRTESTDITAARSFGCLGTGLAPLTAVIHGTIRVGSTAGTYSLDWAQLVSDAGATTLYTDSWLRFVRIA